MVEGKLDRESRTRHSSQTWMLDDVSHHVKPTESQVITRWQGKPASDVRAESGNNSSGSCRAGKLGLNGEVPTPVDKPMPLERGAQRMLGCARGSERGRTRRGRTLSAGFVYSGMRCFLATKASRGWCKGWNCSGKGPRNIISHCRFPTTGPRRGFGLLPSVSSSNPDQDSAAVVTSVR